MNGHVRFRPSSSLVESKEGLISLVQDHGRLVQQIQPAPSSQPVQGIQTLYSTPTIEGVPYPQIFVKFEGPSSGSTGNTSNQRLILPNTLAPSTSPSGTPSSTNLPTTVSTHYVIQPGSSQGISSSATTFLAAVEHIGQPQGQTEHATANHPGTKTAYIIQQGEGVPENSTIIPVGEGLPLGHNSLTLAGLPLTLNRADTGEEMTITTSTSSMLNENDSGTVGSGLGLGQDALLSSSQSALEDVPSDISHTEDTEDDGGLPCVVDPKSFLNTDPTEKITDHKTFLNTTDKSSYSLSKLSSGYENDAKEKDSKSESMSDPREDIQETTVPPLSKVGGIYLLFDQLTFVVLNTN